jgi:nucleotide-binding universal stress UspA family protein
MKKVLIALDYDPNAQKVAEAGKAMAKEIYAEIIAIGSHGRRSIDEIILGSVTEKVLQKSTIPLYIIPTKKKK